MKILFISAFPPARGSLAEYADYFINELKKNKEIDEIIILANKAENSKKNEKLGKIEIVRCWESNSLKILFQLLKETLDRRDDIDLIHFNLHMMSWGTGKLVNFLGHLTPFLLKTLSGKKTIVTLHNVADAIDLNKVQFIKPSPWNKLGIKLITKILLKADIVTVTIRAYKSLLEKNYKSNNVCYIPHGFPETIRRPVYPNKEKSILLFGFLDPRKRLDLLIKAFKKIKTKDKSLKLIIAGTSHPKFPNYLNEIKRKVNDPNVIFTGYVPQSKVKKLFLSSSLVVLPYTLVSGSSGVLHLAASYGKPVVATKLKDLVRVVKDENLLVEFTTLKNIEKSIRKVLYNRKIQEKMVNHNLKAARNLSFKFITKVFVDLYKKVLAKN